MVIGGGFTAAVSAQSSADDVAVNETITNESSQEIIEESIANETSETGTDVPETPDPSLPALPEIDDGLIPDGIADGIADNWIPF